MQLNKLSPIALLILTGVLSACGGGGGDDPAPVAAAPAPAVRVSALALSSTTPKVIAQTSAQFDGGVCSGGTGALTAAWDFGDSTGTGTSNTHIYTTDGLKTVKVTCTDSTGTAKVASLNINVLSAAMNGFLGRTWTTYSSVESNVSPYPIADLATSGDIYGVWIRRQAGAMEVAAGTTNFSSTSWTVSGALPTAADRSPFDDTAAGGSTAAIDLDVSPNGHVLAAWKAGTSIWYATKNGVAGAWSAPAFISIAGLDSSSLKVVVNDAGDGAIAYCATTGAGTIASVIPYVNQVAGASQPISKQCDVVDTSSVYQRHRSFDIAIANASPAITVVGISNGLTNGTPNGTSVVSLKGYTPAGGWTSLTNISSQLATAPESLSFSRSPNGNYAAIAWNQLSPTTPFKSNVYTSFWTGTGWGTPTAVQDDYTTKYYARPLIAVNDSGDAFLAMRLTYPLGAGYATEVSNYDASATPRAWSRPYHVSDVGLNATDIAIDNWGTGLVTQLGGYGHYSQAGTFAKASGPTQWSEFKNISVYYPTQINSTFHYQTMRALPDGRAILVTSVYDDVTALTSTNTPVSSGYMLLK